MKGYVAATVVSAVLACGGQGGNFAPCSGWQKPDVQYHGQYSTFQSGDGGGSTSDAAPAADAGNGNGGNGGCR